MWKCPKCKEECEDNFDSCWNCGTGRDGAPPPPELSESRTAPDAPKQPKIGKRAVISRYADAYIVARTITGIGSTIKVIGIVIGAGIALFGFYAADSTHSGQLAIGGIILGIIFSIPIYILGILVAAQGQILKATLDTAVHTSPLLTKDDMQKIMSLD